MERWKQRCTRGQPSVNTGHGLLFPLQDHAGLAGKVREDGSHQNRGTRELAVPQGGPPRPAPAPQVRAVSSKSEQFLLLPGNGPHVDTGLPGTLPKNPRPARAALAEQGTLWAQTVSRGCPSRPCSTHKLPWAPPTLLSSSQRPCLKTPKQPWDTGPLAKGRPLVTGGQEPPLVRLCDLFKTGEDFEDDL